MLIKEFGFKINFIDCQDNFVGLDAHQFCCENFGWFVAEEVTSNIPDKSLSLDGFWFDVGTHPLSIESDYDYRVEDIVAFKCVNECGAVRYLHLFNHHNGYYCHEWGASWGSHEGRI
jgi:hypothetical protein